MDKVLSLLISAAIIAVGNWIAVGTVAKHSSFVWTLLALFPLLTGFISLYDSLKATPEKLSPVSVLPALSGPGLRRNLIEHGARTSEEPMTVWIYVGTSKEVDPAHLKVFASKDAAKTWLQENDPGRRGVEYEVGSEFGPQI
jgi:hypothetical protein